MKKYLGIFMLLIVLCMAPLSIRAAEPLVNINVVDANVRDILTSLADIGQVNLVADDSVMGKITVQITDTPFASALDIVTKIKGLTYQRVGNVIIVGSNISMGTNFGSVNVFKIKYAQAAAVADTIGVVLKEGKEEIKTAVPKTEGKPGDSKSTSTKVSRLKVDEATNSLIFNGSPSEVAEIQKILDEIDIPYQQVSLECQVMSVNKTDAKNLGIEWNWSPTPHMANYDKDGKVDRTYSSPFKGVGGIVSFGRTPEGKSYEFYYEATLNALMTQNKANVLAKPKITTINGKEAEINIGSQIPIPKSTTTGNGVTEQSVEYKDVGIKLKYTPRINPDGYITAKIRTEVNAVADFNSVIRAYTFTQRSAETQVRLKDGETMVIGGLIDKQEQKNFRKVPLLGDIPILGALFRNHNNSKSENEIVIFLTAHIVK
jgi:type IV pilus assembly protein PilQ